jgi:nitronate monooxygenase
MWPSARRILDLFGITVPVVQAPMAGAMDTTLAIAVARAGGLGSLPAGMLNTDQIHDQTVEFRKQTGAKPLNLNFFAYAPPVPNNAREDAWREKLRRYYEEFGIDPNVAVAGANREPFGERQCELVEALKPEIISFHYGLPGSALVERIKAVGCKLISSATTVAEARFLETRGCDAIIAQGLEAGGHRGMFLTEDLSTQIGTFALVPQIADAVTVPIIASGAIADARTIAAALLLGASAVQIGTAYLFCSEAKITPSHRAALKVSAHAVTMLTNVLTGRPARGFANRLVREVGPMSEIAPGFPFASVAIAPLQKYAQARGSGDFSPMWAGQAAALGREVSAFELTNQLVEDANELLRRASQ